MFRTPQCPFYRGGLLPSRILHPPCLRAGTGVGLSRDGGVLKSKPIVSPHLPAPAWSRLEQNPLPNFWGNGEGNIISKKFDPFFHNNQPPNPRHEPLPLRGGLQLSRPPGPMNRTINSGISSHRFLSSTKRRTPGPTLWDFSFFPLTRCPDSFPETSLDTSGVLGFPRGSRPFLFTNNAR